jgi:hypothetical protein
LVDDYSDTSADRDVNRPSIQAPWSSKGWSTDEYYAERDPVLDEIDATTRGPLPYVRADRPGLRIAAGTNNPYLSIVLIVPAMIAAGAILYSDLSGSPGIAVLVAVLFGVGTLVVLGTNLMRVPSWHSARKLAREKLAEGQKLPPELRWYT